MSSAAEQQAKTAREPSSAQRFGTDGIKPLALEELLAQSDLVTLHVPLDESTCGILNEQRLALMKPTAVLLNAAAALIVAGKAANLREGVQRAARAIDEGAATRALDKLVAVTNEVA